MRATLVKVVWALLVLAAGAALLRGLSLGMYFEPTGDELAEARVGRRWLLAATASLVVLALLAVHRWRVGPWSVAVLVSAGPVCLVIEDLGWITLVAAPPAAILLLVGVTGVLLAPTRARSGADPTAPSY